MYQINYAFSGRTMGFNMSEAAFDANTGGTNVALLVPEPSPLGMLVASLGAAPGLRRFRRRLKPGQF
jgi:hypothetical protein